MNRAELRAAVMTNAARAAALAAEVLTTLAESAHTSDEAQRARLADLAQDAHALALRILATHHTTTGRNLAEAHALATDDLAQMRAETTTRKEQQK